MTNSLSPYDLVSCVRRLPWVVRNLLKTNPNQLIVAGGYIRATVANEPVSDIDVIAPSKELAGRCAANLVAEKNVRLVTTDNAFTVCLRPIPVQFVHRWTFADAESAIASFDFTIARAAFWWDGTQWASIVDPAFYSDLAAKRLVYCSPVRIEEAGGSMLRVLKFYQKGYRIPLDSLGAVIARTVAEVDFQTLKDRATRYDQPEEASYEQRVATIVTGLLREVDPLIDPDHVFHLASETEQTKGAKS